jgi:hypothetical protein
MAAVKDVYSREGNARLVAAIKKEQFFTRVYSNRAQQMGGGGPAFRVNVNSLRPVALPVGARDHKVRSAEELVAREHDLAALHEQLALSARRPIEKLRKPQTAAQEIGFYASHDDGSINRAPITKAYHARSAEVAFAEHFSIKMGVGPFSSK